MIFNVLTQCDQYLVRDQLQRVQEIKEWLKSLEDFLNCRSEKKIQIVAICSDENVLSYEELKNECTAPSDAHFVDLDKITKNEDKIYAKSNCILISDLRTIQPEDALQSFFSMIAKLLSASGQALTAENGNDDEIKHAKMGIENACNQIYYLFRNLPYRLKDELLIRDICSYLKTGQRDGEHGNNDGFPKIRILVFLPEKAFEIIAQFAERAKLEEQQNPTYYFFEQILAVAHDEGLVTLAQKASYENGYRNGYQDGYTKGYRAGYEKGCQDGNIKGKEEHNEKTDEDFMQNHELSQRVSEEKTYDRMERDDPRYNDDRAMFDKDGR